MSKNFFLWIIYKIYVIKFAKCVVSIYRLLRDVSISISIYELKHVNRVTKQIPNEMQINQNKNIINVSEIPRRNHLLRHYRLQ